MNRIEIIEQEIEKWNKEIQKIDDEPFDQHQSFEEYYERLRPFNEKIAKLDRELRMLLVPEFDELPNYGDVMSLKHFIENVRAGAFIDYDGWGNYVKDKKISNIVIRPSDVKHGAIRKDFDTIIWFNK